MCILGLNCVARSNITVIFHQKQAIVGCKVGLQLVLQTGLAVAKKCDSNNILTPNPPTRPLLANALLRPKIQIPSTHHTQTSDKAAPLSNLHQQTLGLQYSNWNLPQDEYTSTWLLTPLGASNLHYAVLLSCAMQALNAG